MKFAASGERVSPSIYFIIAVLPFFLFYWMLPFIAGQSIGQDYQTTSIENQMELFFSIKTGSFPLYAPGFALGHSSSALTLGEIYHPLSHLASILPGYWDGKALQCNTLLRLLSLGLTHLALFVFLRRLNITVLFSFLLSCITVYNLRMLDLFRYGASLEAYTAHLLLCAAIGFYFINSTDKERPDSAYRWLGPLSITCFTYLLVCSGHPQMMYYGLLGSGLFLLVTPYFVSAMLPDRHIDLNGAMRFWFKAGLFLIVGILLSSAYVLPFYFDFIATNVERAGQNYAWADSYGDTLFGTLNSFFLPFRSDVHGTFGGSSLIIMAALLPVLRCFRVKIPRSIWIIWGLMLFTFLHMQSSSTPVHKWVWEYLPFASSFRIAGRISLIMPILMMMLLAGLIKAEPVTVRLRGKSVMVAPINIAAMTALLMMALYFAVSLFLQSAMMTKTGHFTPVNIRDIPRSVEVMVILSGMAALVALALYGLHSSAAKAIGIFLCLATIFQITTALTYGTWITGRNDKPTFEQMQAEKKEKLDYRFYPGTGMYSSIVTTQLEQSFMEPFLGKIFSQALPVSDMDDAYDRMREGRTPLQVFVEGYEPGDDLLNASNNAEYEKSRVELVYSSFNRLQFRTISPAPAFFGLSYPYTDHWNASVNGQNVSLYRANGSAHAVEIPEGESLIEFRYASPYSIWGMAISCLTFILFGSFIGIRSFVRAQRIAVILFVLGAGSGMFLMWQHSLYAGDNLNTEYTWTYKPTSQTPNLAYGKKTSMSSHLRGSPGYNHSSRATDGNTAPNSGFSIPAQDNPSWTVDLNRLEKIKTIILYENTPGPSSNKRPLNIDFSEDGKQWRTASSVISAIKSSVPTNILFETPELARYIKIQGLWFGVLGFDEVEVYGPEKAKL